METLLDGLGRHLHIPATQNITQCVGLPVGPPLLLGFNESTYPFEDGHITFGGPTT